MSLSLKSIFHRLILSKPHSLFSWACQNTPIIVSQLTQLTVSCHPAYLEVKKKKCRAYLIIDANLLLWGIELGSQA